LSGTLSVLREDTEALALPQGRRVGRPGHEVARHYLLGRLQEIGLEPFTGDSLELPFTRQSIPFTNLAGRVPGRNSTLPQILVGAHYDSVIDAPCADDNATAVAVALAVATLFRPGELERDLVIALFDSEEPPYFHTPAMGSTRFYEDHCWDRNFACVIVMDLIGHDVTLPHPMGRFVPGLKSLLFLLGCESSPQFPPLVEEAADEASGLKIVPTLNRYIGHMSDYHAFRLGGEPFLFLSCGQGKHYHQPTDDLRWINFAKVERVFEFVASLVRRIDATTIEAEMHDPAEFEIAMLKEAFGLALPVLLQAVGRRSLEDRADLDALIGTLAAGLA